MKLEHRTEKLRDVRRKLLVPGVMYGKSIDSTSIQVEDKEFKEALKTYGKSMTFKARLDGKYHFVYIKNVQTNILKPSEIIHFDLHRVTAKETITAKIPVHMVGSEVFHNKKLYPELVLNEVTAEYIPGQGVSSIDVDVSKLELGDHILVKDLKLSEGLTLKDDPNHTVIMVKEVHVPVEEETEAEETSEVMEAFNESIKEETES